MCVCSDCVALPYMIRVRAVAPMLWCGWLRVGVFGVVQTFFVLLPFQLFNVLKVAKRGRSFLCAILKIEIHLSGLRRCEIGDGCGNSINLSQHIYDC